MSNQAYPGGWQVWQTDGDSTWYWTASAPGLGERGSASTHDAAVERAQAAAARLRRKAEAKR